MTHVAWSVYFQSRPKPHDPFDHLVAGDYYEERGDVDNATLHRDLAAFWAWVKENDLKPAVHTKTDYRYKRPRWGFHEDEHIAWIWSATPSVLPGCVFQRLPNDGDGDLAIERCVMWWYSVEDAWLAPQYAWLAAHRAGEV